MKSGGNRWQRLSEKFAGLGEVFAEQAEQASQWLAEQTSILQSLKSLFRKDDTPAEIEKSLIEAVQKQIEKLAGKDSDKLVSACRGHWLTVIPRIEERLEMPPPDFEKEFKGFEQASERFQKRLGGAARKAVVAQKIRSMLEHEMESQRDSLRRFVTFALLLFTGAGSSRVPAIEYLGARFVRGRICVLRDGDLAVAAEFARAGGLVSGEKLLLPAPLRGAAEFGI